MDDLQNCDVVMKGGITSGIVYPQAIIELSKKFRFKNVGGTSAGAIAAGLTAAAEYGRGKPGAGFDRLTEVPPWLAANLRGLFQPQPKTRRLFGVFLAAVGRVGRPPDIRHEQESHPGPRLKTLLKVLKVWLALLRGFPVASAVGAAPGAASLIFVLRSPDEGALHAVATIASLLLIAIGVSLSAAVRAVLHARAVLPQNYYGLCFGWAHRRSGHPPELTQWLSECINELGGRKAEDPPLTFRDLWGTRDQNAEHKIELAMITTNLTHGRPYRLPFEDNIFYFDPEQLGELFPPHVIQWMLDHPGPCENSTEHCPLRPLPDAPDLPVIVAVRLSLSFPGLISAVPLHAIDKRPGPGGSAGKPEPCWFSDGGITSNFPVHFFDSVLPRWPTFAINLREHDPVRSGSDVWMPESNNDGITQAWHRFDQKPDGERLGGFARAILLTMQNWMDNLQLGMPGYRDRVVHIALRKGEGGLNLDMPSEIVRRLSERGGCAGIQLKERFADAKHPMGWDNHRWIRFRSSLAVIERTIEAVARGYNSEQTRSYEELIQRGEGQPPEDYWWATPDQRQAGFQAIGTLVGLGRDWTAVSFDDKNAPTPRPVLRIMPKV